MKLNKRVVGFLGGILLCVIVCLLPLNSIYEIPHEGQMCLGLTLMAVVWWACEVAHVGFTSGLYLMLLYVFKIADINMILNGMIGTVVFLMMSTFMISSAIRESGLGQRIAYAIILRFIRGWKSLIATIFILQFILSIIIPHPFPRSFIIMAIMSVIIKSTNIPRKDSVTIGLTVFASSIPVSLIFITSDSTISPLAASFASEPISFLGWFVYYGVPAIFLSALTFILILVVFPNTAPIQPDLAEIRKAQAEQGKITGKEIRCLVWTIICVVAWFTNSMTDLTIGHMTFMLAMLMAMPIIGETLHDKSWNNVPLGLVIFITTAIAIGIVGGATGMNAWLANVLVPDSMPNNIFLLALLISVLTMVLHMVMGSVIAVMGVAMPIFLPLCARFGISEIVMIGIVYLCCAGHYLLPFHHLTLVVGQGEENGMYTQKETFKLGLPMTAAVLLTVMFAIVYWMTIGIL